MPTSVFHKPKNAENIEKPTIKAEKNICHFLNYWKNSSAPGPQHV
jgi:hypothetical protein